MKARARTAWSGGSHGGKGTRAKAITVANVRPDDDLRPVVRRVERGSSLTSGETVVCPSCGKDVRKLKNGRVGTHRLRNAWNQSWPCRGDDEGTP